MTDPVISCAWWSANPGDGARVTVETPAWRATARVCLVGGRPAIAELRLDAEVHGVDSRALRAVSIETICQAAGNWIADQQKATEIVSVMAALTTEADRALLKRLKSADRAEAEEEFWRMSHGDLTAMMMRWASIFNALSGRNR